MNNQSGKIRIIGASAGTGKTYTIENLLLEYSIKDVDLSKIVVITYTNNAINDLKTRFNKKLENLLEKINKKNTTSIYVEECKSKFDRNYLKNKIKNLIDNLSSIKITTIHKFCHNLLESYSNIFINSIKQLNLKDFSKEIRKNFIDLYKEDYLLKEQILFLKKNVKDIQKIEIELIEKALKVLDANISYDFKIAFDASLLHNCKELLNLLNNCLNVTFSDSLFFILKKKFYIFFKIKKLYSESKQINKNFLKLITKEILSSYSHTDITKEKKKINQTLIKKYGEEINPIINFYDEFIGKITNKKKIFLLILLKIEKLYLNRLNFNIITLNDSVKLLLREIKEEKFLNVVKDSFKLLIIDEVQDINFEQLQLIKEIIDDRKHIFFALGDYKQSIYMFQNSSAVIMGEISEYFKLKEEEYIFLYENRRSTQVINSFINDMFFKTDKNLFITNNCNISQYKKRIYSQKKVQSYQEKNEKDSPIYVIKTDKENLYKDILFYIKNYVDLMGEKTLGIITSNRKEIKEISYKLGEEGIFHKTIIKDICKGYEIYLIKVLIFTLFNCCIKSIKLLLISKFFNLPFLFVKEFEFTHFNELQLIMRDLGRLKFLLLKKGFICFFNNFLKVKWIFGVELEYRVPNSFEYKIFIEKIKTIFSYYDEQINKQKKEILDFLVSEFKEFSTIDLNIDDIFYEDSNITITTVHGSKGLQFDNVILFNLCKTNYKDCYREKIKYKKDENNNIKIEGKKLCVINSECNITNKEEEGELVRILYVGLTRAKSLISIFICENKKNSKKKCCFYEFFSKRNDIPVLKITFQDILNYFNNITNVKLLEKLSNKNITLEETKHFYEIRKFYKYKRADNSKIITSFSKKYGKNIKNYIFIPDNVGLKGESFGKFIHAVLSNKILFCNIRKETDLTIQFVEDIIKLEKFNINSKEDIVEVQTLLKRALFYEFSNEEHSFKLIDVYKLAKTEIPFSYIQNNNLFEGRIDFLLQKDKDFFLIDWKTNYLGENLSSYSCDKLEEYMETMGYKNQLKIYKDALKNFIELKNFNERIGGIFFVFLRGLEGEYGLYKG